MSGTGLKVALFVSLLVIIGIVVSGAFFSDDIKSLFSQHPEQPPVESIAPVILPGEVPPTPGSEPTIAQFSSPVAPTVQPKPSTLTVIPTENLKDRLVGGVKSAFARAETLLGSKARVYVALAIIGVLVVGAIIASVFAGIYFNRPSESTLILDLWEDHVVTPTNLYDALLIGHSFQRDLIIWVGTLTMVAFGVSVYFAFAKENIIQVMAFFICVIGACSANAFGFWQLGGFSNMALSLMFADTSAQYFFAGFATWIIVGLIHLLPSDDSIKRVTSYILAVVPHALFAGAMGGIGTFGYYGAVVLALSYVALLVAFVYRGLKMKTMKAKGGGIFFLSILSYVISLAFIFFAPGSGGGLLPMLFTLCSMMLLFWQGTYGLFVKLRLICGWKPSPPRVKMILTPEEYKSYVDDYYDYSMGDHEFYTTIATKSS